MVTFTDFKTGVVVSLAQDAIKQIEQWNFLSCNECKRKGMDDENDGLGPCFCCAMQGNMRESMLRVKAGGKWYYIEETEEHSDDHEAQEENLKRLLDYMHLGWDLDWYQEALDERRKCESEERI